MPLSARITAGCAEHSFTGSRAGCRSSELTSPANSIVPHRRSLNPPSAGSPSTSSSRRHGFAAACRFVLLPAVSSRRLGGARNREKHCRNTTSWNRRTPIALSPLRPDILGRGLHIGRVGPSHRAGHCEQGSTRSGRADGTSVRYEVRRLIWALHFHSSHLWAFRQGQQAIPSPDGIVGPRARCEKAVRALESCSPRYLLLHRASAVAWHRGSPGGKQSIPPLGQTN